MQALKIGLAWLFFMLVVLGGSNAHAGGADGVSPEAVVRYLSEPSQCFQYIDKGGPGKPEVTALCAYISYRETGDSGELVSVFAEGSENAAALWGWDRLTYADGGEELRQKMEESFGEASLHRLVLAATRKEIFAGNRSALRVAITLKREADGYFAQDWANLIARVVIEKPLLTVASWPDLRSVLPIELIQQEGGWEAMEASYEGVCKVRAENENECDRVVSELRHILGQ